MRIINIKLQGEETVSAAKSEVQFRIQFKHLPSKDVGEKGYCNSVCTISTEVSHSIFITCSYFTGNGEEY